MSVTVLQFKKKWNNLRRSVVWGTILMLLSCAVGCRQTYEDPRAFVEKYVEPYLWEHVISKSWLKPLELKRLVFEDVRLEADYGTAVCATLRLVPRSDRTIYMYAPVAPYMPGKILTKKESEDNLTATISIKRFKMDNGVFAPITKICRSDIQGYGLLGQLRVVNPKAVRKNAIATIEMAREQINSCNNSEKLEKLFKLLVSLAENRHLDYLDSKETFQQYCDNLERCFIVADNIKKRDRIYMYINNEALSKITELCRNYNIPSPRERMETALRKSDFNTAQAAARIILANKDKDAAAHFAVGMWYYQQKQWKYAEQHLIICKDINPKDVAAWNNLAMIYLNMGRLEVAKHYASRALSMKPDSSEIKDTLMQIENAMYSRRVRRF